MATKTDQLHMRIAPALKAELLAEAQRRHIDLSALISVIAVEWLARNRERTIDVSVVDSTGKSDE